MSTPSMRSRLKFNRPSLRRNARPPRQRTPLGAEFTAANLASSLSMQVCRDCNSVQYPPREVCAECLGDELRWQDVNTAGSLLVSVDLHHSMWEFFKRRVKDAPWPVATVRLDCGVTVFAHVALASFESASADDIALTTRVKVFSHTDASRNSVLIAVADGIDIATSEQRLAIATDMGLTKIAIREDGI